MAPGNITGDHDFTCCLGVYAHHAVTGTIPCGTDVGTWFGLRVCLVLAFYPVKTRLELLD